MPFLGAETALSCVGGEGVAVFLPGTEPVLDAARGNWAVFRRVGLAVFVDFCTENVQKSAHFAHTLPVSIWFMKSYECSQKWGCSAKLCVWRAR